MPPLQTGNLAYDRPGGEVSPETAARPIDMAHLARQTMGDRALEQEVLQLFAQQAVAVRKQLSAASPTERIRLAHGLKGSARGVGAFAIAECVASLETRPDDAKALDRLSFLIDQVCDFISAIHR
ncbi:MAG TPA: Hpt domain-containing protein [Rhizobiales bacterium]|nr:Hpt domain-containing protein [Hyphomicrobiales bacterium]